MNREQFINWITRAIAREGGQVKFADKHKIDRSVLSLVMTGKREPSEGFVKALGWKKEAGYSKETK